MTENNQKSEYLFKICLIGSSFDLRDKLIRSIPRTVHDPNRKTMTLGVDISTFKNTQVKLILDYTMGTPFFINKLRPNYYRGSSACIIVFDKSDRSAFDAVPVWLEEFRKHIPSPDIPVALLGINTKEEDVSSDECKALAELLDLPYFETSSPKFENSFKVFEYLSEQVIK